MMKKILFWVSVVFVFFSINAKVIQPRDLADEAQQQVEELKALVQGEISSAHIDLEEFQTDYETFADNVLKSGNVDILQAVQNYNQQLQTIKDLAAAANVDIAQCTDVREEVYNRLPDTYIIKMTQCVRLLDLETVKIISDAKYIVDIVFNKVQALERQLKNCQDDLVCISPILTEIELNKLHMPQGIKTSVQNTKNIVATLKLLVQDCSDNNVMEYTLEAGLIISDIATCVDRTIG